MGKWYAGVVHSHTTRSDGAFSPEELVKKAEEKGLDFLIITDHNQFCIDTPKSDKLIVIPGTELTIDGMGHTNVWGVEKPFDNFECPDYEEWNRKMDMAREAGATICINHPLCSNCGWHWPLEPEKADCVEVWNSPQHTDNIKCTEWWQDELRKGKKIPAVGGSDYHRDYVVTDFLDNPTSYVYAEEYTQEAILKAIREGHVTIAPHCNGQMIEITSGNAIIGDTVKLENDTKVTITVNVIKPNQTLKVIDSEGVLYSHKQSKAGPYSITIPVKRKGFICAQVEYNLPPVIKQVYAKVEKKVSHNDGTYELPPFISSQTSAIYFE